MIRVVTIAIAAAIATGSVVSSVSAQSAGANAIVAQMAKDPAKMKAACSKGREGVTAYVTDAIRAMMQGGATVNPADGQAAGEAAGKRCPEFMR